MLKTSLLVLAFSAACFGSAIHTITFTGVATEASGYDPYFQITQTGQTFTASIEFTHASWDGQSALSIWNNCGGCVDPYDLFDHGNGQVLQTQIGPQSGGLAGLMHVEFDATGLTLFEVGSSNWGTAGVRWTPTDNSFSSGQPGGNVYPHTYSAGYLTSFAYDGGALEAAAAAPIPNPEPGYWLLVAGGLLVMLRRSVHG